MEPTEKFLDHVSKCTKMIYIRKDDLVKFTDEEIKNLVSLGLLGVSRTVADDYLISIPNAGLFMKCWTYGRKILLKTLKSTKYHELHQHELEKRKLPKNVRLGFEYLILEMIGSDVISWCVSLILRYILWSSNNYNPMTLLLLHITASILPRDPFSD